YCGVKSLVKDGVTFYFIDNEYYFNRPALYGNFDDGERYAFFCKAALEMMPLIDWYPDVLHAHDWQAALSVVYLNTRYRNKSAYEHIKSVFTIHNIEYQGQYDMSILGDVFELGVEHSSLMHYDDCLNLMKAAVVCADMVSTVSPKYAEEIKTPEYAHRLNYVLEQNAHKLTGILNGIDYDYYNPAKDLGLVATFDARRLSGKAKDKAAMQAEAGLPVRDDVPVLAVISRLAAHKGLDLISQIADKLVAENDVQLIVLGKGEARFEQFFADLAARYPDKVAALLTYDRDLAKRIYAATDIFLMPSKSEPCGLSQMIASRYGAVPVVRETGGLYDSIKPYWEKDGEMLGNGFTFANYSGDELLERTCAAIALYSDRAKWKKLVAKVMRTDFSWAASADKYLEMYADL
ncbi:MAG: glycogen synthase, partial [Clostridia bacterium]|nr:glycogen synthase [Clostridia bacterium]